MRWILLGDYDGERSRDMQDACLEVITDCHNQICMLIHRELMNNFENDERDEFISDV